MHLTAHGEAVAFSYRKEEHSYLKSKMFLVMKLTTILLLAACMQLSAAGYGQRISISGQNMPLRKVFTEIQKQSGYTFFYSDHDLEQAKTITLDVRNAELAQVLSQVFRNQPLTYTIIDKTVVIKQNPLSALQENVREEPAVQPPAEIRGKVLDDKTGEPVVGASVRNLKTGKGTMTDKNGAFTITADPGETLEITFVGFESKTIIMEPGVHAVTVRMAVTNQSMKEFVVTGIFTRPKQNFTGSSSSFTTEELQKVTNNNLLTALKTLDPSFQLPENINLGSNPNALPEVVLRGGNSLVDPGQAGSANPFNYTSGPNTPLFILDGFEVSLQRINDLDMNRIAKVDILKDAAATSIYGSRAANGVIVIETIRPTDGKLRFTYNGSMVVETPDLTGYDLLNAEEKLELERKANVYVNNFNTTQVNLYQVYSARLAAVRSGVNTDWLSKPLQTGIGGKHNIYLEGGGNNALYGISATYDQRTGVMKGSDRRNISLNNFLSYRIKSFNFRNDLTLNFNRANNSPYGSFTQYARLNPYWTPYDSSGQLKLYLEDIRDINGNRITTFDAYDNLDGQAVGRPVNPLYNANLNVVDQTRYQNFMDNFFAQWQAARWLRLSSRFSYQQQKDESDKFLPAQHTSFSSRPTFEKGSYTKGNGENTNIEGMFTADINKAFDKHLIFATLGTNLRETKYNTVSYLVQGFPNARLDQVTLGNRFPDASKPTGSESISRLFGLLSNVSYSYDSRYLLDFSYRKDGSSQFGSNNRFASFWSLGAGWNVHNESFFKGLNYINRLKLRYSFGYTGSQNFPSYLALTTSRYFTSQEYRGLIGSDIIAFGNPNLSWQRTQKNNLGADITLFNRLDIVANYFVEKTQGSIATISTPPSVGFTNYSENIGDVVSRGFEVNTRFNIIQPRGRSRNNWSVYANLFHVNSTIERISNTLQALNKRADTSRTSRPIIRYAEGQSTSAIWAVRSLGIDPANGTEIYLSRDGKIVSLYDPRDQVITGDSRPEVEGTFGTNFELKGIGLNMVFRVRYGGQAYNQTLIERVENVNVRYYNVDRRVAEQRWLKPGDVTFFKGLIDPYGYAISSPTYATSRFVQDDNSVNCESLSLYYRFSDGFNKRFGLENTKFTFYTNNLFQFSSIKRERGLDYPFSHSYTIQLQTSF